jgi:uncharacterized protein YcsI (UPF0317 family)
MSTREDAHQLLDTVPDDQLDGVIQMLRRWSVAGPEPVAIRQFRTVGVLDAEPDYGERSKDLSRTHRHGVGSKSA